MKHELVDLGNGQVYVVNIPTNPSEGSISKEDAVILNLWKRIKKAKGELDVSSSGTTAIELTLKYLKENNEKKE